MSNKRKSSSASVTSPIEIRVDVEVEEQRDVFTGSANADGDGPAEEDSHAPQQRRRRSPQLPPRLTLIPPSSSSLTTTISTSPSPSPSPLSPPGASPPAPHLLPFDTGNLGLEVRDSAARLLTNMSLPRSNYDPRRVCLNPFPEFTLGKHRRTMGVYLAGALFSLANWTFLDAAILSAHAKSPYGSPDNDSGPPVHVTFTDWVPGLLSLLGYLVIVMIDKDRVRGEEGLGDSRAVWRARLFLFIGFAMMAGGLAGSVTVLVLKYILGEYPEQFTYYGYANVSQNVALMLSAAVLWIATSSSSEYEYNLTL